MQVSIIMPYYNAAKYINETVDAIIAQTYKSWELIIVDDCSPAPGTNDILKSIAAMDSQAAGAKIFIKSLIFLCILSVLNERGKRF